MADADYTDEIWKVVPFAPVYELSDHGRVRRDGRFLKPWVSVGYVWISLSVAGKVTKRTVHSLVADLFLPPRPTPKHEVAHWDGDRKNPHFSNLRWATRKENFSDKLRHGTQAHGENVWNSKLTENDVKAIRSSTLPQRVLAKKFGTDQGNISRIKGRKLWRHLAD